MNRWLSWLNISLLAMSLVLGLITLGLWFKNLSPVDLPDLHSKTSRLPKSAFELDARAYEKIDSPLLSLEQSPPTLQVPDLRQQLIYYGKNGRPDGQANHVLLHFSLNGNKTVVSVAPGEKLYLFYDRKNTPNRYIFSPQNEKTSLWIEGSAIDQEVLVKVFLENDKGEQITEPASYSSFRLPEKEFTRYAGASWEIGSWRVDGTLLARQRARWFGPDRFLEHHGGPEYEEMASKQRVDFGENEDVYSVFVKIGDCLIWDGSHWKVVKAGENSLNHPLLVVKKIEDRLMSFELWDVEGKGKVILNLLKSNEPWLAQNNQALQHIFKFVGARTKTQCVFEINQERIVLSPSDWLLQTPKGWKKLVTEEEIDNYVKRKTLGTLFVFKGISRKDERQILKGTLYNPSRNDSQEIELALQTGQAKQTTHTPQTPPAQPTMTKEMQERLEKMHENLKDRTEIEERIHRAPVDSVKATPMGMPKSS